MQWRRQRWVERNPTRLEQETNRERERQRRKREGSCGRATTKCTLVVVVVAVVVAGGCVHWLRFSSPTPPPTNDDDLLNRGKGSSVMSTARPLGCRCARVPPSLIFSERIHRILVSFCRLAFASPDAQPNTIESSRSRQLTAAAIIIGMHPERRQQLFTTTTTKTTRRTSKQYPFGS